MTSTMTREQAQNFRTAYEGAVKRYSKMAKAALAVEDRALLADKGMERIAGGPQSKDELISDILNLRGYTPAKLNEATHVLYHEPGYGNTACELCCCQVHWIDGPYGYQCSLVPGHEGDHADEHNGDKAHTHPAACAHASWYDHPASVTA